jgi:histidine triad (HIT) family protein
MGDCVFCQIIQGTAPVSLIYHDEVVWVFLSTLPANPGHTLVIPRQHVRLLQDMDEPTGRHLFTITMRTQQALRMSSLQCEAVTLFLADGIAASQSIPHLHLHVVPRFVNDGFQLNATGG